MPLKEIHIRNFQIHQNLKIKLGKQVTTVVGESDCGKSAIVRALRWLCLNKPSGQEFITVGKDECEVTLVVDDHTITRRRGKSVNSYTIDGTALEAFGCDVPDCIQKVLNVCDINFQNQHDAPYWFGATAGEVSKELNEIVNLDVIDAVISYLNSAIRKCQEQIEIITERRNVHRTQVRHLQAAKLADQGVQMLESQQDKLNGLVSMCDTLHNLIQEAEAAERNYTNATSLQSSATSALATGQRWHETALKICSLSTLVEEAARLNAIAKRTIPKLDELEAIHTALHATKSQVKVLSDLIVDVTKVNSRIKQAVEEEIRMKEEFSKNIGKVCPLCQQPIKSQSL